MRPRSNRPRMIDCPECDTFVTGNAGFYTNCGRMLQASNSQGLSDYLSVVGGVFLGAVAAWVLNNMLVGPLSLAILFTTTHPNEAAQRVAIFHLVLGIGLLIGMLVSIVRRLRIHTLLGASLYTTAFVLGIGYTLTSASSLTAMR